ncbi:pimeloyl-ACP methyl ester carboxylesterase [Chitinophaga dinghuensis]|uniref:Pimeloyl-ACP methyl ester carboxylesterase n=1 Tax=Chitinophaga dinghuensis TaxID=1539050 RepID=A0A327W5Q9_9BACT|nr:alpha/beta hydrolase [Chitinophaga dinghuensis]RAJ83680.1 pimeloyl-ACP methyl ester carboxylesterase [Chitinophaga dinghuensis]
MKHLISAVRTFILAFLLLGMGFSHSFAARNYSFAVKKEGHGKPIILIHGLYCSGAVWDETVAHYKNKYTCYELTLPGFAGQPPLKSDTILKSIAHELAGFIRDNKLEKPVIIGHSLGGWLAMQFGIMYPELPGKLVCVSTGPFLPAFMLGTNATADSARPMALQMKERMSSLSSDQIRNAQRYMLSSMISDTANIRKVMEMAALCDSYTQGEVMYELYTTDLRQQLNTITCPILALGDWSAYKDYGSTRNSVLENYKSQYQKAPQTVIAINDVAKHFIMMDQPGWFFEQLDAFLK